MRFPACPMKTSSAQLPVEQLALVELYSTAECQHPASHPSRHPGGGPYPSLAQQTMQVFVTSVVGLRKENKLLFKTRIKTASLQPSPDHDIVVNHHGHGPALDLHGLQDGLHVTRDQHGSKGPQGRQLDHLKINVYHLCGRVITKYA